MKEKWNKRNGIKSIKIKYLYINIKKMENFYEMTQKKKWSEKNAVHLEQNIKTQIEKIEQFFVLPSRCIILYPRNFSKY